MTKSARLPIDFLRSLDDNDVAEIQRSHGRLNRTLIRRAWAMANMKGEPPAHAWLDVTLREPTGPFAPRRWEP